MDEFALTREAAVELRRELRRKTGKKHHMTRCIDGWCIWPYPPEFRVKGESKE